MLRRAQELGRAARTIRWLRPRQIAGQVARRMQGPPRLPKATASAGIDALAATAACPPASPEGEVDDHGRVWLFGGPPYDPLHDGWRLHDDPLVAYTRHYHGWLSRLPVDAAASTIESWIAEHQHGIGWEAYPTSMRLLHWLGWLQAHGSALQAHAHERVLSSIGAQMRHLAAHVEHHIDGNHVWTNLAALVACGAGLRGPLPAAMLERFAPEILRVTDEQVAPDGVHRERTPSYHCLLAEQLAIVVELCEVARPGLAALLRPRVRAMAAATSSFVHPDGDVALWGDSQLDAPARPLRLLERVGASPVAGHATAGSSGFVRRAWGPWTVLWNVGDVGLAYQPGHVHADALALEVSLGTQRAIVDAGVGTYSPGLDRAYARGTRAHNTVTVGHGAPDQHELWASHRIGGRARVRMLRADDDRLAGAVLGYRAVAEHERIVTRDGEDVVVEDRLDRAAPATARWFVPGDARVMLSDATATVSLLGGASFELTSSAGAPVVARAPGWTAIGRPAPRICLAMAVPPRGLVTRLRARP